MNVEDLETTASHDGAFVRKPPDDGFQLLRLQCPTTHLAGTTWRGQHPTAFESITAQSNPIHNVEVGIHAGLTHSCCASLLGWGRDNDDVLKRIVDDEIEPTNVRNCELRITAIGHGHFSLGSAAEEVRQRANAPLLDDE